MYRFIWKIVITDPSKIDPFIQLWHDASVVLQEYPGARGTHLHKVLGQGETYLAIADWESKAARDGMKADVDANTSERAQRWQAFEKNENFGAVEVLAEVEEITVVMPAST